MKFILSFFLSVFPRLLVKYHNVVEKDDKFELFIPNNTEGLEAASRARQPSVNLLCGSSLCVKAGK